MSDSDNKGPFGSIRSLMKAVVFFISSFSGSFGSNANFEKRKEFRRPYCSKSFTAALTLFSSTDKLSCFNFI